MDLLKVLNKLIKYASECEADSAFPDGSMSGMDSTSKGIPKDKKQEMVNEKDDWKMPYNSDRPGVVIDNDFKNRGTSQLPDGTTDGMYLPVSVVPRPVKLRGGSIKEFIITASIVIADEKTKSWPDGFGPQTPWGKAQQAYLIERGVTWFGTAGHGGLAVATAVAKSRLSPQARILGERYGSYYWYEEDAAYTIPFYEHPEWNVEMARIGGGKVLPKEELESTIKKYFSKYFEQGFISDAANEPPSFVSLKAGDLLELSGSNIIFKVSIQQIYMHNMKQIEDLNGKVYRLSKYNFEKRIIKITRNNKVVWEKK